VNLIPRLMRGRAGRRAVIGAAVLGLLTVSLSAAEGGVGHLVQRQSVRTTGKPAEAMPGRSGCSALAAGIRLLHQAVRAARRVSYQGVQVISWRAPGGSGAWLGSGASRVTIDVWHRHGVGTLTRVAAPSRTWSDVDHDQSSPQPAGMLGLTPALIGLLCAHYTVRPDGMGLADGRQARIVEAFRGNGSLAARFWLDSATKLPLRRETFGSRAQLVTQDVFVSLKLGVPAATQLPATGTMPSSTPLASAQLAGLRAAGWPLPGQLPGHLTLVQADQTSTPGGRVVDLAYSDGLSVISLFLQRGHLPPAMNGWQQVAVRGQPVYTTDSDQRSVAWSAHGFVYTMIADAPAETVDEVVSALPHTGKAAGFLGRMDRGLHRLASWVNPFR